MKILSFKGIELVLVLLFCCSTFISCSDLPEPNNNLGIEQLYWVEGEWKGKGNGGMMFEVWQVLDDGSISGVSISTSKGNTIFSERMRIVEEEGEVYYKVKVDHNESEVAFKFVEKTSKGCVFKNPEHDFPTRIIYARTNGDMLLARIEGIRNGQPDTVRFFMNRNLQFSEK